MKKPSAKNTITILISSAMVLGLAGTYYGMQAHKKTGSDKTVGIENISPDSLSATIRNSRSIGSLSRSTLKLTNSGSFRFGAEGDKSKAMIDQKIESSFQGEMEEIVFEDDGKHLKSYIIPSHFQISLRVNDQDSKVLAEDISRDLVGGFVVIRDRSGLVLEMVMAKGARDVSSDFAFAIAKAMQNSFPEGGLKPEWTAMEEDNNGQYQARYKVMEKSEDLLKLRKERLLYSKLATSIEGNMGGNSLMSRTSGEVLLDYDLEGQSVRSASGLEKLVILDENSKPLGGNEQTIDWRLIESGVIEGDRLANLLIVTGEKFSENKAYTEVRDEASERQLRAMYEARLGQDNLETILKALKDVDSVVDEEASRKIQTEWFLKARALVYLHPEELPRIQDLLRSVEADSAWFQTMTSALVNIANPEAQKVLADLALERKNDPLAMQTLIPDLGFVQKPEPTVEAALRALREDEATKGMADLSFATMGSQLSQVSDSDAEERRKVVVSEIHSIAEGGDIEVLKHKLDMIGNLSSNESLPVIAEALKNPDVSVRSIAAFALRDLTSADAETVLRNILLNEKDVEVRKNAALALQNHRPTEDLLKFERSLLESEESAEIRIQLLISIAKAKYIDGSAVRQTLEARSKGDAHEQVRNYADLLLTDMVGS